MKVKVEISARHFHLTEEDYHTLFGDEEIKVFCELSQTGEFAAVQKAAIVGPKNRMEGVRLVGPFRQFSQVEISATDARSLGVDAPVKMSGDLPGASIKIEGPCGSIEKDIAIIAKRHLHISTEDAGKIGIRHEDIVKLKIEGDRALVFDAIVARVNDNFVTAIHLDTDEANAALIKHLDEAELIIEES